MNRLPTLLPFPLLLLALDLPFAAAQQPVAPAGPTPASLALQQDCIRIARSVTPSVVTVRTFVRAAAEASATVAATEPATERRGWIAAPATERDYPGFREHGAGSGFFVSAEGDVLTGLEPLRLDGDRLVDLVEVETADGHRILTDVVGIEPTLQLAVLHCAVYPSWTKPSIVPLPFGDSDALEVGSLLFGVGDPAGPERYLGTGLLVAKPSRDCYQELMSATYMQATMPGHPGALGGPLVDLDGKVVGILCPLDPVATGTSSATSTWALPSKILQGLYESIRAAGTMQSPWLGISVMSRAEIATTRGMQEFQKMDKPPHGILIENVWQPGPAAGADVQPGDFLTDFEGVEIHAPVDFQRQLYLAGVGRRVQLTFYRAGTKIQKELLIQPRPAEAKPR